MPEKRRPGRPKVTIDWQRAIDGASAGMTDQEIAAMLKVGVRTWRRYLEEHDLYDVIRQKQAQNVAGVLASLMEQAKRGKTGAARMLLERLEGKRV